MARIYIIFILASNLTYAEDVPAPIGNFSLPNSQQPGPFYSFGQNIVDTGNLQLFVSPTYINGVNHSNLGVSTSSLYGVTDDISLLILLPITINDAVLNHYSSGLGDVTVQGEYAFYNFSNRSYSSQATVLGNFTLPTGSPHSEPTLGNGIPTYFLGATYNLTTINWIAFASAGTTFTHRYKNDRSGAQYYYQSGFGRVLNSKSNEYIFLGLFELDGQYNNASTMFTKKIPGTGGNIVYATPSLWFSTKKLILQWGFSIPVTQYLNRTQDRKNYYTNFTFGWTF